MDDEPEFDARERRLSGHIDAARLQLEAAQQDRDRDIEAAWRRLIDELERVAFEDGEPRMR